MTRLHLLLIPELTACILSLLWRPHMPRVTLLSLPLLLSIMACGPLKDSEIKGHYEDMDPQSAEALVLTQPRVIEEHGFVDSVAISSNLVRPGNGRVAYGKIEVAVEILKTGAGLSILLGKDQIPHIDDPELVDLKEATEGFHDRIRFIETHREIEGVWARDWAPLQAVNNKGEKILLDFNYYKQSPAADLVPSIIAAASPQSHRLSVPVYNEGGNFMVNSRGVCMMTTRVVGANSNLNKYDRPDDKDLTETEIIDYYQRYAGCKEVHIFPRMPLEATGHIDMFAKYLNDDTIIVNEISDLQLEKVKDAREKKAATNIKAYLDDMALGIQGLGFKLIRLPMPIPQFRPDTPDFASPYVIRTYSNSLIINRQDKKVAIVPRYSQAILTPFESSLHSPAIVHTEEEFMELAMKDPTKIYDRYENYSDHDSISSYEDAVREAYAQAGYETVFIASDELIKHNGSIHCATMQFAYPL